MNVLDMEADMAPHLVTKLTMSVRVAVWICETGSGPPTHVRASSEPIASPVGLGRARLVAPNTNEFGSLEREPSRTRTCMGTLMCTGGSFPSGKEAGT
jgi:hypothetical protein